MEFFASLKDAGELAPMQTSYFMYSQILSTNVSAYFLKLQERYGASNIINTAQKHHCEAGWNFDWLLSKFEYSAVNYLVLHPRRNSAGHNFTPNYSLIWLRYLQIFKDSSSAIRPSFSYSRLSDFVCLSSNAFKRLDKYRMITNVRQAYISNIYLYYYCVTAV